MVGSPVGSVGDVVDVGEDGDIDEVLTTLLQITVQLAVGVGVTEGALVEVVAITLVLLTMAVV